MISVFPPKSRYWLGLKQPNGRDFEWADGVSLYRMFYVCRTYILTAITNKYSIQADVDFTYWAPGNPIAGDACVYGQQSTGFNSLWYDTILSNICFCDRKCDNNYIYRRYSAPCTDPLKYSMSYACQLRPCDTEFDCLA